MLAIAAFLGRKWLKHRLSIELKAYETQLTQKTEALKTELSIYAHEQNVGLTRIDAQRSEAVLSIWGIFLQWQEAFMNIIAPNELLERNPGQAVGHYKHYGQQLMIFADRLSQEVARHSILFDEGVYATISRCGKAMADVGADFYANTFEGVAFESPDAQAAYLPTVRETRQALRAAVANNVEELRQALVREFRRIMTADRRAINLTSQ